MNNGKLAWDWWCEKCDIGYYSPDIEESDENAWPLCPQCGKPVIDPGTLIEVGQQSTRDARLEIADE
jgi:NAD-dependent SIR2 family protein deacetylase